MHCFQFTSYLYKNHIMEQQNYSSHHRYVPGFHFVTAGLTVLLLVIAVINLVIVVRTEGSWYPGIIPLIASIILLLLFWYSRAFAVKVQDRAIRAEENFRHYIMTGKPLDRRLTMGQIVSLRFAGDDEYLSLTERAINEKLSGNDIKKAIKNWRADHFRC